VKIGLIGLPLVGKTTLYNLLTDSEAATSKFLTGKTEPNLGMAKVPDLRIDWLSSLFKPKKTIFTQIETTDLPGLSHDSDTGSNAFLHNIRQVDALVQVIRAFEDNDIEHVDGKIDPFRDFNNVNAELLLADMDFVEKRLQRIQTGKKVTAEQKLEQDALHKYLKALEEEKPLSEVTLTEAEAETIKHYSFFTNLPQLIVINVDESQFKSGKYPTQEQLEEAVRQQGYGLLVLCAEMENEIAHLPQEDQALFMEDLGIVEAGTYRLARSMYELVGLISFFTVGEDEVRAWTIEKDLEAKKAAGKIHSDLERGFIRAEVVAYHDLFQQGTMNRCKEKGLLRLEGKEYKVKDGDILNIRFNV
jgi:hypothetical protein